VSLRLLVVDDERPALDELAFLLDRDPRVASVATADSAAGALRELREGGIDAVFTDIRMPGLTGLELAGVLSRFRAPVPVVFITAYEGHAVDAFDLHAVDYLLKPVREDRLAEAVRRVVEAISATAADPDEDSIPVELGGVTRFVVVGGQELTVSRRHTRELRDLLVRRARPGGARS
jgi:DNA-binding LytR/AlgR family response regulator